MENGWWKLETTIEPTSADLEHIARLITEGYDQGIITNDEVFLLTGTEIRWRRRTMKEWTTTHRSFEIGERVVVRAKKWSLPNKKEVAGQTGTIHSYEVYDDTYFIVVDDGKKTHLHVSPFEIEPVEPSSLARQKAAQAWCTPKTSSIDMDTRLAEAFAKILDEYIGALQWCSGSKDFHEGGTAEKGWDKLCRPLI